MLCSACLETRSGGRNRSGRIEQFSGNHREPLWIGIAIETV